MTDIQLRCTECHTSYPAEALYACERCFAPLAVHYPDRQLSAAELGARIAAGPPTIWRYADFLPCSGPAARALPVGNTPLIGAPALADYLGVREVWVKNEAANPTHSFKDRVVAVALARAVELGFTETACASTGNLANAVAAHSAALGLPFHVLVPDTLEASKYAACVAYGDGLIRIDGSYDDINRLCGELAGQLPWAFVNLNLRPYYSEGSKTMAFEIAEQLGYELPDRVICPAASGSLFTKLARGFGEWLEVGLVHGRRPAMHAAQPAGCSPIAQAYQAGAGTCRPVKADTAVTSLAIGDPADGAGALDIARSAGGSVEAVTDEQMRAGVALLARTTGIFCESAGGVTTAALTQLAEAGALDPGDRIVLCITGTGLKTADSTLPELDAPVVAPTVEAVTGLAVS